MPYLELSDLEGQINRSGFYQASRRGLRSRIPAIKASTDVQSYWVKEGWDGLRDVTTSTVDVQWYHDASAHGRSTAN